MLTVGCSIRGGHAKVNTHSIQVLQIGARVILRQVAWHTVVVQDVLVSRENLHILSLHALVGLVIVLLAVHVVVDLRICAGAFMLDLGWGHLVHKVFIVQT